MSNNIRKVSLQSNTSDYVALAAKAVSGMAPFVGSLLAELAGAVIPNQRIDRIAKFSQALERRLSNLEEEFVSSQISNEQFTDLLEEGLRQSARSLTDERRDHIASVIANSVSSRDIEYIESKHLLRILDEINDIEVVWLKSYSDRSMGSDNEFREKHKNLLRPLAVSMGSSQEDLDKETLQKSYKEHLVQLGLLKHSYKIDDKTKVPKYDSTGVPEVSSYDITRLGKLLVRQISFNLQ
jgi:oligoendopeptidase F